MDGVDEEREEERSLRARDVPRLEDHLFKFLAGAVVVLLTTGTVTYHALEDWSWVDSFYFSVIAVTTVGFGDLTPSTDASKLFTVAYLFTGIGLVTTYVGQLLRRVPDRQRHRRERRRAAREGDGGGPPSHS